MRPLSILGARSARTRSRSLCGPQHLGDLRDWLSFDGEPAGVAWVQTHRQEADQESRIPDPGFNRSINAATCESVSAMLPFVSTT